MTAAGKEIQMGYSRKEVLEEVDKTIINLCEKCRALNIGGNGEKLVHALTDLIEVRASMPDWREKQGASTPD